MSASLTKLNIVNKVLTIINLHLKDEKKSTADINFLCPKSDTKVDAK